MTKVAIEIVAEVEDATTTDTKMIETKNIHITAEVAEEKADHS